jgi:DNA-binding NarL/FixJ family response regulator
MSSHQVEFRSEELSTSSIVSKTDEVRNVHAARQNGTDPRIVVAVLDTRTLNRECVSRCLATAIGSESVLDFENFATWLRAEKEREITTVILLCSRGRRSVNDELKGSLAQGNDKKELPPVVVLSEEEDPTEILAALDAGAKGYIPTSVSLDVAIEALRLVMAGGTFIPASSLMSVRNSLGSTTQNGRLRATGLFTERQASVVEALRQGKANKIIAHELRMRESTVKVHVRNIMRKLKATNRTQVAYLTQHLFDK